VRRRKKKENECNSAGEKIKMLRPRKEKTDPIKKRRRGWARQTEKRNPVLFETRRGASISFLQGTEKGSNS